MKKLMTGNEAVARGAYEAGVHYASAYPGTPSTEILENTALYKKEIRAEWAPNEKVALESAMGASVAGARAFAAMKHVGVNVAADPMFTAVYTGINGGFVIITADEPGQHSSQNEQDNRYYAKFAKMPLLEPADSQECKDMMKLAFEISETFDTPVLFRMTTRICHSKGIVECEDRVEVPLKDYVKDINKYITVPAKARQRRIKVENQLNLMKDYTETTPLNFMEMNDTKIGVITSGCPFNFAKEVFGEDASYLKLGFTNPLPKNMIADFASKVDKIYVIEENDPFLEEFIKALGIECHGLDTFPYNGEMTSDVIRQSVFGQALETAETEADKEKVVGRPPTLCPGCPHRGIFYELGKRKNTFVSGDIGCYTLAFAPPYNAMDINIAMGASISMGHGAQHIFNMKGDDPMRVVSVLGDSTFFHTGINSLLDVVYNRSNTINLILDNRITGMTGHQENPGSGYTLQGMPTKTIEIEPLVRACGIDHVRVIDPNNLDEVNETLDWAYALDEPSVIITRFPCVLKKFSPEDKEEFKGAFTERCIIDQEKCIGCRKCIKTGCPALTYDKPNRKSSIDPALCVGCEVCLQVCPVGAITKEEN